MAAIEVLPRRFIEVWQKSEYVSDVAQKLRLSKGACRMRAWRYKNHYGVPLKVLPTTRPAPVIDWDEMAELAASLLPDDEARRLAGWRDDDDAETAEEPGTQTGAYAADSVEKATAAGDNGPQEATIA
jgi:hypothetical protein